MTTTVLLADDQELVRTGIRMILEAEDDLAIVGEARTGREAVALVVEHEPDVVLMDIRMPGMDGVAATEHISNLTPAVATRVLVLTTYDADEYVFAALRSGAAGFLLKHAPSDVLVEGVRTVARGEGLLAPQVTRRVIEAFARIPDPLTPPTPELDDLTEREREVFDLVIRGLSNAEIADELFVEPSTVKTHVAHALTKLGLSGRVAAVIYAYEHGVLVPGNA